VQFEKRTHVNRIDRHSRPLTGTDFPHSHKQLVESPGM
jgi:hypothetical protein